MEGKRTMTRPFGYEAILYGLSLESLTIGSLMAKRGRKVLFLSLEDDLEGSPFFVHQGFLFDAFPCLWPATDPAQPHPALAELGISLDLQLLRPGLQVVLPRHRFSLYAEEDLFQRELQREFPRSMERLNLFLRRMKDLRGKMERFLQRELASPSRGLRDRWSRSRNVPFSLPSMLQEGKLPLSPYVKDLWGDPDASLLVDALLLGLGGVSSRDCNALFAAFLFGWLREPIYYPSGGTKGIYEALLACFSKNGGELCSTSQAPGLIREGKKLRGLATVEGEEFHGQVLLGGPALWQLWQAGDRQKEAGRPGAGLPQNQTLTLCLGVDQEVLPEEMGQHLLLVPDPVRSGAGPGPIWMTLSPGGDETRAPQGERALSVSLTFPLDGTRNGIHAEEGAKGIMAELEDFLPFLSQGLHLQRAHLQRSFSLLQSGRRWGLRFRIAPLKQMGYPGLRPFSLQKNLFLIGDLPIHGIGPRAQIEAGGYWTNLLAPLKEG